MRVAGVGGSPRRVGGHDRVTGFQQYAADIHLPDELHARLVRVARRRQRRGRHETTKQGADALGVQLLTVGLGEHG